MSLISVDFASSNERLSPAAADEYEDDFAYHQRRAEQELRIAQDAELQVVRRFHYHLAALHLDRAHAELGARASVEERRVA
jgi:hypothetical protein